MANRECYPASLFPLRGDVSAEAGATTVLVTGIGGIPVFPPVLLVNGVGISFDFLILADTALVINYASDGHLGIRVNGV